MTMKIKAPSFADLFAATSLELVLVRRIKFLETLIPLHNLKAVSNFTKAKGKRSVQSYLWELMIRIFQFVYNLSDTTFSCRRFVGLTMNSQYPDETTILRFRHLLGKSCCDKKIFLLFK